VRLFFFLAPTILVGTQSPPLSIVSEFIVNMLKPGCRKPGTVF
jgi:hypothetical protein